MIPSFYTFLRNSFASQGKHRVAPPGMSSFNVSSRRSSVLLPHSKVNTKAKSFAQGPADRPNLMLFQCWNGNCAEELGTTNIS